MGEEAKINFYKIKKCGYYHTDTDKHLFSSIESTLNQLNHWAFEKGRQLNKTCTYQVSKPKNNTLETYCFDIAKSHGDFLLVTWNKTETLNDAFASVRGTDPAGHAHVKKADYPSDHIPGYPTFFWFIPSKDIFATIKFNNQRLNGHYGLKLLISNFLKTYSDYVCRSKVGTDQIKVVGYFEDLNSRKLSNHAKPIFETKLQRNKGELDFIIKNSNKIKKVHRRTTLHQNEANNVRLWRRMLENLGVVDTKDVVSGVNFQAEFPLNPTENEVKSIIKKWKNQDENSTDNVGFDIHGVKGTKWLSHTLVKADATLDVERNDNSIISASSLIKSLKDNKELALIVDSFTK